MSFITETIRTGETWTGESCAECTVTSPYHHITCSEAKMAKNISKAGISKPLKNKGAKPGSNGKAPKTPSAKRA